MRYRLARFFILRINISSVRRWEKLVRSSCESIGKKEAKILHKRHGMLAVFYSNHSINNLRRSTFDMSDHPANPTKKVCHSRTFPNSEVSQMDLPQDVPAPNLASSQMAPRRPLASMKTGSVTEETTCYSLGDEARAEDMAAFNSLEENLMAVACLRENDYAFVRRSGGKYTYAMVQSRQHGRGALIELKVTDEGATKSIPMNQWGNYIRPLKSAQCLHPFLQSSSPTNRRSSLRSNSQSNRDPPTEPVLRRRLSLGSGNPPPQKHSSQRLSIESSVQLQPSPVSPPTSLSELDLQRCSSIRSSNAGRAVGVNP